MSGLHIELCKRSLEYLKASEKAFESGLYNASGVMSQISAELAIKATISFLGYSFPETHEIRRLISVLSTLVLKDEISEFVKKKEVSYYYLRMLDREGNTSLTDSLKMMLKFA